MAIAVLFLPVIYLSFEIPGRFIFLVQALVLLWLMAIGGFCFRPDRTTPPSSALRLAVVALPIQLVAFLVMSGLVLTSDQSVEITIERPDSLPELRLRGRKYPGVYVVAQKLIGLAKIEILDRLRLGSAEVIAQGTERVAYLLHYAVFPARHII